MVELGPTKRAMLNTNGTGTLSFHYKEQKVVAALCSQPHAFPFDLWSARPRAFTQVGQVHRFNSMLSQHVSHIWVWPAELDQCSITLKPPLGLQAHVTKLNGIHALSDSL